MSGDKRCTKCDAVKPLAGFTKDSSRADGYASRCRACRSQDKKAAYAADKPGHAARAKRWRTENREYKSEYDRGYYQANKERCAANRAAWTARNRAKKLADDRAYYAAHKDVWAQRERERRYGSNRDSYLAAHRAYNRKYKSTPNAKARHTDVQRRRAAALLGSQVVVLEPQDVADRFSVFGCRCLYCGGTGDTRDHVKPIARGGPHILSNLVPACRRCNAAKGAKRIRPPMHVGVLPLP